VGQFHPSLEADRQQQIQRKKNSTGGLSRFERMRDKSMGGVGLTWLTDDDGLRRTTDDGRRTELSSVVRRRLSAVVRQR